MRNVPIEILSHIFSFLDFSSRREAALVCRAWYEASLGAVFLRATKYTFDASVLEGNEQFYNGKLSGCLCKSPNLHIVNLDENFNAKFFLNLHKLGMRILGPHVQHLSLKNSNILEATLLEILQHCENIKSLDLSGCNTLFMSGAAFTSNSNRINITKSCLKNITALNLSSSRYMNDATLCQLFTLCPLIESINLSSNNVICNMLGVSKSNSLTFLVIQQVISRQASFITHVDFSRTSIVSDALSMLATTRGLQLKSVVLQSCRELTDKGVIALAKNQLDITMLELSGSPEIGNSAVFAICTFLKKLEILKLRKCSKVTSVSVKNLNQLENLRELDISECYEISMPGLQCGITGMQKLRILQIKCCNLSRFRESFFLPLLSEKNKAGTLTANSSRNEHHFTHKLLNTVHPHSMLTYALRHLDIGSSQYVNDVALQAVSMYLTNLQVLKLAWSSSITDRGLLGLETGRSPLEGQAVEDVTEEEKIREFFSSGKYSNNHGHSGLIQKPGSEYIAEKVDFNESDLYEWMQSRGIIRLKKLRELNLSNCKKLSPVSLHYVFSYMEGPFPDLEKLDLGMLYQAVTDDTLKVLGKSARLRALSLAFCGRVTDEGLGYLCKYLRSLETLNLSNCDGITEKTLVSLTKFCPWLKELDVSMCRKIVVAKVNEVKQNMPSLSRLHTRYSGGASLDKTL